jgi:putative thioredoxin
MMSPEFIIDVTEADFEYEVIAFSQNTPVVVDFWAEWCRPCKDLAVILEKLAHEAQGVFRLARVNVDQNPNLALRFAVRSIPNVKAFSGGEVVAEFSGAIPEGRIREFISRIHPPSPAVLMIERATGMLAAEQWYEAEQNYREALMHLPDHPEGLLGLARALLAQGKGHESLSILTSFPASRQYSRAEILRPLAAEISKLKQHPIGEEPDDQSTAYWNTIRLAARGQILAAMDGLLDLLREDRQYDQAREVMLGLMELLGDENPQIRIYRRELASILF